MPNKVDCFIEYYGCENPFSVNKECTGKDIKKYLSKYHEIEEKYFKIFLDNIEIIDEKSVVEQGLKYGNIMKVELNCELSESMPLYLKLYLITKKGLELSKMNNKSYHF
jgi:hypothetical protein